ncbi:MAG: MATE family efflux transporter [Parasporobacterium sp.]|nr:MATE family efflux transporter [Parasporobacterium sp.]
MENNLTQGSVFRKLWVFTLPFIGANLLQTLYGMVDLYIVGRYAETSDVAAVSISGTVIATFLMILIGLSVGATVLIGQRFGAGEQQSLGPVSATAFTLSLIFGGGLMIIVAALTVPVLHWINTPEEAMGGAISYMLICSIGYIFQSVFNMLSGILRGMGDSKSPLLFVGVSTVVNIIGDVILIGLCGLGAAGAAIATMLAQLLCMVFGILYVRRKGFPFDFHLRSLRLMKEHALPLLKIGIPVALQEFLVMFSFIIIEGIINSLGLNASAAAGILDKIFLFATIPTYAFNSSISAMVAQNVGARQNGRAVRCLWYGSLLSELFAVVFFLLGLFIPGELTGIFTRDSAVISEGISYFAGYKYEYLLCSLAFCVNGFINGTGHTRLTLINNVVSTYVVRIPACLIVSTVIGAGLFGIGYALPIASLIQAIVGFVFFFSGRWKNAQGRP